jgi:hypothetical protein
MILERVQITVGSPVFQQFNAKIYTAANVKVWLATHDVVLENWPPYSPDLNPMSMYGEDLRKSSGYVS